MQLDQNTGVFSYLRQSATSIDGKIWLVLCCISVFCLVDLLSGGNLIPLREKASQGKAIVLLLFSPLLIFLIMVALQLMPFAHYRWVGWMRGVVCIASFLVLNF